MNEQERAYTTVVGDTLTLVSPMPPIPVDKPEPPVADLVKIGALLIEQEARRAMELHAPMHSGHEGKAIIEEELDELWDEIKLFPKHDPAKWRKEAIHVGAMALRFLVDLQLVHVSHPPEE